MKLGLIGHPVAHSRSPAMHTGALAATQIAGSYEAFDIAPEALGAALADFRAAGFCGLNVTVPHKEAVIEFCDVVDPAALRLGAVNTVVFEPDRTLGFNTDLPGFLGSLRAELDFEPSGRSALVIGAGGAARAVVAGLCDAGATVHVANRTFARAVVICNALGGTPIAYERHVLASLAPDLVVNTTAVGMDAAAGSAEWEAAAAFFEVMPDWPSSKGYDVIYTPRATPFLSRFPGRGTDGLDMLVRQGALSFQRWTGVGASQVLAPMRQALGL